MARLPTWRKITIGSLLWVRSRRAKLGEFWVRHRIQFDLCFHGPAKRHKQTLEIASEHVRQAGLSWPESQAVPELDEFDAFRMMQLLTPKLVESDPEVQRLSADVRGQPAHTGGGPHAPEALRGCVAKLV